MLSRLLPNIRYGTERYPEKVARRLRALNIAVGLGATMTAVFAVMRLLDPAPGMFRRGVVNAAFAVMIASIPLLHRFGQLVAPLAFVVLAYAIIFRTSVQMGTGGGAYLHYLTATVLGILFMGTERVLLTVGVGVVATALIIILHILAPYDTGRLSATSLFYGNFITNVITGSAILYGIVFYAIGQITRAEAAAEREYERSESLLLNILPPRIAARLKQREGSVIADRHDAASILFADMAGFTSRSSDTAPDALVQFLNDVFTRLDGLVERHGLEKIKTTGDAYMVVSGVPEPRPDHAAALADLALDMHDALNGLADPKGRPVLFRMGIASGPVVAGVVGTRKFFYDVWGDAVNTASRMETTGETGKIQVAPETYELLRDRFDLEERGLIEVRGKGQMRTWYLIGRRRSSPGSTASSAAPRPGTS
jgi:adenylate cyclase